MKNALRFLFSVIVICLTMQTIYAQNNALKLNGVDDCVTTTNPSFYGNNYTIEGWFKTEPNAKVGAIISIYTGKNSAISVQLSGDKLRATMRNPPSYKHDVGIEIKSNTIVNDGNWHHFALVRRSDNKIHLYIDGVFDDISKGTESNFGNKTYTIDIGRNLPVSGTSARYFKGQLDEIRFWDTDRTAAQISANYNIAFSDLATKPNLKVLYNFDNISGTTVPDVSGNSNIGTIQNNTGGSIVSSTIPVTPERNNAIKFNGAGGHISTTNPNFYKDNFTIEGWFKTALNHPHGAIASVYKTSNNGGVITVQVAPNGKLRGTMRTVPAASGGIDVFSTSTINDGNWHHFALVKRSDNKIHLYIDGAFEATSKGTQTNIGNNTYALDIGRLIPSNGRFFNEQLDEIRLWDTDRTAAQISANYNVTLSNPTAQSNLVLYYNFDNVSGTEVLDISGNSNVGRIENNNRGGAIVTSTAPISGGGK